MATFKKFNEVPSHNTVNNTESFILTDENGNVFRVPKQDMFKIIRNNTFADWKNVSNVYNGQWWRILRVQIPGADANCSFSLTVTESGTGNSHIIHGIVFVNGYSGERFLRIISNDFLREKLIEKMSITNEDGRCKVYFKIAKDVRGVLQITVRSYDVWNFESSISNSAISHTVANDIAGTIVTYV